MCLKCDFIDSKYKKYSLRFIIVLIIDLTDNMLLLHNNEFKFNLKCDFTWMSSVILFIANKYKEYSLRVIIVFIIDITGNMWLLLHNNEF